MSIPVSQQLKSLVAKIEKNVPTPKVAKAIITDAEKLVDDSKRESREAQLVKALKPVTAVLTGKDDDAKQRVLAQYGVEVDVEPEKPTSPLKQRSEKAETAKAQKAHKNAVVRNSDGSLARRVTIHNLMLAAQADAGQDRLRFDVETVRVMLDQVGVGDTVNNQQIRLSLTNLCLPRKEEAASRIIREDRGVFIINPKWKATA